MAKGSGARALASRQAPDARPGWHISIFCCCDALNVRTRGACIHTCAHVRTHTFPCECACSRLQEHVTVSASPARMNYLAHICLSQGWVERTRLSKLSSPWGPARHNTHHCFPPSVPFDGNRANNSWVLLAKPECVQAVPTEGGCRSTPHLSQRQHPSPPRPRIVSLVG